MSLPIIYVTGCRWPPVTSSCVSWQRDTDKCQSRYWLPPSPISLSLGWEPTHTAWPDTADERRRETEGRCVSVRLSIRLSAFPVGWTCGYQGKGHSVHREGRMRADRSMCSKMHCTQSCLFTPYSWVNINRRTLWLRSSSIELHVTDASLIYYELVMNARCAQSACFRNNSLH